MESNALHSRYFLNMCQGWGNGRGRGPKCRRLKGFINNNKQNKRTKTTPAGKAELDKAGQDTDDI